MYYKYRVTFPSNKPHTASDFIAIRIGEGTFLKDILILTEYPIENPRGLIYYVKGRTDYVAENPDFNISWDELHYPDSDLDKVSAEKVYYNCEPQ